MAAEEKIGMRFPAALFASLILATSSAAAQFAPLKPLDLKEVDALLVDDIFGKWQIRDRGGRKRCEIALSKEPAIGGYAIEVSENCKKSFPVMQEIAGWRLLEGWIIDLIDATRKTRVRFSTPDNRYVAIPEVDGVDTLIKLPGSK